MMIYSKLILIFILLAQVTIALPQDEFYFNKMFLKDRLQATKDQKKKSVYDLQVASPLYKVDLNFDKHKEGLLYQKDNGRDLLHVYSHKNKLIKSFELDAFGKNAVLDKIVIKQLSKETNVMILYFYAGEQEYIEYKARGHLYFISIDIKNLDKMSLQKGPTFWSETKDSYGNYHKRNYTVELKDLNSDGTREILVRYASISQVCMYLGEGKWNCK